jgi:hypothetical protein
MLELRDTVTTWVDNQPDITTGQGPGFGRIAVLAFHARCVGLYRSCCILIESGQPEEAAILGRSLMDDALRLAELERSDSDRRKGLALRYLVDSLTYQRKIWEEAVKAGIWTGNKRDAAVQRIADDQAYLTQRQTELGLGRLPAWPTEGEMARSNNRSTDYIQHVLADNQVHGSVIAHRTRTREVGGEVIGFTASTSAAIELYFTACFAVASMLQAHMAMCQLLGWPTAPVGLKPSGRWTVLDWIPQTCAATS